MPPKVSGVVVQVNAGRRAVQRLSGLGITPGTEITKMSQAPFRGPVQISVRGSRLALGRGLAHKIIIRPN
ncbi:MAG: ferrous iron transport protein A [Candidatus Lokiarchaeota archaeon]|nr:ferrous iron transport protein A [Candidatus Lokiarchaeota archaeon]